VNDSDLDALLSAAVDAAARGGAIVREAFGAARNVVEKAPGDWVSDTDTASERAVRDSLLDAFPDIPVVGEEEGGERASLGWLVDPLDGTANFLHHFPVVGVSIALVADGEPIVAVVGAPLLGDTYTARLGGGAHRDGEPLRVGERSVSQAIEQPGASGACGQVIARVAPRRTHVSAAAGSRSAAPGPAPAPVTPPQPGHTGGSVRQNRSGR
jgi:myo-inositol-1(or 4)-monophosphatase